VVLYFNMAQSSSELSGIVTNMSRVSKRIHANVYALSNEIFATSECNVSQLYARLDHEMIKYESLSNATSNLNAIASSQILYLEFAASNAREDISSLNTNVSNLDTVTTHETFYLKLTTSNIRDDLTSLSTNVSNLDAFTTSETLYLKLTTSNIRDDLTSLSTNVSNLDAFTTSETLYLKLTTSNIRDDLTSLYASTVSAVDDVYDSLSNLENNMTNDVLKLESVLMSNIYDTVSRVDVRLSSSLSKVEQDVIERTGVLYGSLSNLEAELNASLMLTIGLTESIWNRNLSNSEEMYFGELSNLHGLVMDMNDDVYDALSNLESDLSASIVLNIGLTESIWNRNLSNSEEMYFGELSNLKVMISNVERGFESAFVGGLSNLNVSLTSTITVVDTKFGVAYSNLSINVNSNMMGLSNIYSTINKYDSQISSLSSSFSNINNLGDLTSISSNLSEMRSNISVLKEHMNVIIAAARTGVNTPDFMSLVYNNMKPRPLIE
jgi:hypothetical protein